MHNLLLRDVATSAVLAVKPPWNIARRAVGCQNHYHTTHRTVCSSRTRVFRVRLTRPTPDIGPQLKELEHAGLIACSEGRWIRSLHAHQNYSPCTAQILWTMH